MDEALREFQNEIDDNICVQAAERAEVKLLLNDGQDHIFSSLEDFPDQTSRSEPIIEPQQSVEPSFNHWVHGGQNISKWSTAVERSIQHTYKNKSMARDYLQNYFFSFEDWPCYMVELFVLNSIAMYSYNMRNKICLFFWGNGATIDIMFTLSEFFAPPVKMITHVQQNQYNESVRKCQGLFETYERERMNPAYSQRYYFYSLYENKMLYIDGRARHYGRRQEDSVLDGFPIWYRHR